MYLQTNGTTIPIPFYSHYKDINKCMNKKLYSDYIFNVSRCKTIKEGTKSQSRSQGIDIRQYTVTRNVTRISFITVFRYSLNTVIAKY